MSLASCKSPRDSAQGDARGVAIPFGTPPRPSRSLSPSSPVEPSELCTASRLRTMLSEETDPVDYVASVQDEVTPAIRASVLRRVAALQRRLEVSKQSLVYAARILDSFLSKFKVKTRHCLIIGVASLTVALRILREREFSAEHVVSASAAPFSDSDLIRMQKLVQNHVDNVMPLRSALDFVPYLLEVLPHGVLPAPRFTGGPLPSIPEDGEFHPIRFVSDYTSILTKCSSRLMRAVAHYNLCCYKPSALALATLFVELEDSYGHSVAVSILDHMRAEFQFSPAVVRECAWRFGAALSGGDVDAM